MTDLKEASSILTNYSLIVFIGTLLSFAAILQKSLTPGFINLVLGGLPLAIIYLAYRKRKGKIVSIKKEVLLLLIPVLLSPLAGIIIALVILIIDKVD